MGSCTCIVFSMDSQQMKCISIYNIMLSMMMLMLMLKVTVMMIMNHDDDDNEGL